MIGIACHLQRAQELKEGPYLVTRDCCQNGNCGTCVGGEGHVYGRTFRCVQFVTFLREMAEKVCFNFRAYNARVEPPTEEVIAGLHPRSRVWVRAELSNPAYINNRIF